MTPQPQGQIRLSGSMTSSMRGSAAGKLPTMRFGAALVAVLSQILLEFECGHRPDITMLRAQQTAEMR